MPATEPTATVVNSNGIRSPFSTRHVLGSLIESGVPLDTANARVAKLAELLTVAAPEEVSTGAIRHALEELAHGTEIGEVRQILVSGIPVRPPSLAISRSMFANWQAAAPKQCKVPTLRKTLVYSRGNNDKDELNTQKAKTGKYVYTTGTFQLSFVVDGSGCLCDGKGDCVGQIAIRLDMKILLTKANSAVGFSIVPGPDPSAPTKDLGGGPPKPNLAVTIDQNIALPKATPANQFRQPNPARKEFDASAEASVPCTAGTYNKRFYLVDTTVTGAGPRNFGPPGIFPIFYVDCQLDVTKTGDCQLGLAFRAYMVEFLPNYDFTHGGNAPGADKELPEVQHEEPGGAKKGATRNIAKLISEDGVAVDAAYPPEAP